MHTCHRIEWPYVKARSLLLSGSIKPWNSFQNTTIGFPGKFFRFLDVRETISRLSTAVAPVVHGTSTLGKIPQEQ